ncbi:hypothetical protein DN438_02775 [Lactobacillus reuteri]|uniref:hypothetical protein n=1 Tax=Limosilactobacillus reuteri TaxID=1598 RepID=UPI00128B95E2|nr:hypothetical protein [Limosilactobacillus reuteri]MQB67027.1 hypothetical protein [Limosilactobacillus reuteri]
MTGIKKKLSKEMIEKLHQDILSTVRQSYPGNGYQIVSVSASSNSESLYVYIVYKQRLYYLRFSAHNNEIKGHGYTSFNLLEYESLPKLRAQLHSYFMVSNQTNAYKTIGYYNFVWLALAYRCSTNPSFQIKFEPADEVRKATIYMEGVLFAEVTNSKAIRRLLADIFTGLITSNTHIDKVYRKEPCWISITPSGIKLLKYYPNVSKYGTKRHWLTNPSELNTQELVNLLNSIS